jgi:inosine triphosphate pyrophosphatase
MANPTIIPINIITSNPDKFADCQLTFQTLNTPDQTFQVKQTRPTREIQEIQSMDVLAVARHKMDTYLDQTPIESLDGFAITLIEDSSLELAELGGFPGPYIKDFYKAIGGSEGLAKRYAGSRAIAKSGIVISRFGLPIGEFVTEIHGTIAPDQRGEGSYGYADVFIPYPETENDKTLAEMDPETRIRYQPDTVGYRQVMQCLDDYARIRSMTRPGHGKLMLSFK